ncbi:MAG: hypothetical protein VX589_04830 [Myxococcota bacterium]|nr:hypothetical protein [Myxococcota bacterium]
MKVWVLATFLILVNAVAVGCDEVVNVENRSPRLTELAVCKRDGQVLWQIGIGDTESDPTDVVIRLDTSGLPGIQSTDRGASTVTPGQFGDGLVGLTSTPEGVLHTIAWAICGEGATLCKLGSSITSIAGDGNCSCVDSLDELTEVLPAVRIELRDRAGAASSLIFDDGLPITTQCPAGLL